MTWALVLLLFIQNEEPLFTTVAAGLASKAACERAAETMVPQWGDMVLSHSCEEEKG